ncbi:1914_t:CDS:2, partial [Dentiscutata erythropus]
EIQPIYFVGLNNKITIDDKVFSTPPQKKYKKVKKLLKPNPPEHALLGVYPYNQIEFTPPGISARLGKKTKSKHWKYDWKGPNTQCWCVAKSYWATPNTEDKEETIVDPWNQLDETSICLEDLVVQDNEPIEESEDNFTNQLYWLELLETLSKRYY